ncbi:adenylate kinase [Candidatus Mycoplasma haematolamae str. Purdue]|uniref:Adenylate kinase n=1 Tax=Mycoplasma haematolamae (strain Purdue) TaxID=1212765 RepID=I7BJQ9_MYCHA|nr:adenylate kinase [Candidatus Mycoplasma haematolamae str. Purdue]
MIRELEKIEKEAMSSGSKKIFITLDGYPRTMGQATCLEDWAKGKKLYQVRLEGLSEKQIAERLSHRWLCKANEHIFNTLHNLPQDGRCPKDGSELIRREDDSQLESIKRRMEQHESLTTPIWEHYSSKGYPSYSLNSNVTVEELYSAFCKKFEL